MANSSKPVCHAASRPAFRASSNDAFCILVPLLSRACLISAGWPGPADAPRRAWAAPRPIQVSANVFRGSRIRRGWVGAPEDRAARRRAVRAVVRDVLVGHLLVLSATGVDRVLVLRAVALVSLPELLPLLLARRLD